MKSMFVTLLSGLLIYAGYYFHPIVHRIGNQITSRLQAEFVPVNKSFEVAAADQKINAPTEGQSDDADIASDTLVQDEDQNESAPEIPDAEVEPDNTGKNDDIRSTRRSNNISNPSKPSGNATSTGKTTVHRIPNLHKPVPNPFQDNNKPTFPPKYDLYSAIKKGIDVRVKTNEYFISDRDREIGREFLKIEEDFDKKYNRSHLTAEEIDRLQAEHDSAIQELAKNCGLSRNQLLVFGAIIKQHL